MARLIPNVAPSDITNSGERITAEALIEQLSDRFVIIHSFGWLRKLGQNSYIEGECDFVLLDPNNGILFVEVKGGTVKYDPTAETWVRVLSGGQQFEIIRDPFDQVRRNMHTIIDIIIEKVSYDLMPFTYGYAAIFPDGRFHGQLPPSISREQILDSSALENVDAIFAEIFGKFRRTTHRTMSRQELEDIKCALFPRYEILPVLWRTIDHQEQILHRLTEDQKQAVAILKNQKFAVFCGGAGTGKTFLALNKAQELAQQGSRTLLLCYNRFLRDWLIHVTPKKATKNLTINTYHEFALNLLNNAGIKFAEIEGERTSKFWNFYIPEKLMNACNQLSDDHKFDSLIIDEGQDFHRSWWYSLETVIRKSTENKCCYIFLDPHQNLYVKEFSLPEAFGGDVYQLDTNCRNTKRIAKHCATLVGAKFNFRPYSPEGSHPEIIRVDTLRNAFEQVNEIIGAVCRPSESGLKMSQVAVLTPGSVRAIWPTEFKHYPATEFLEDWWDDLGVLITSYQKFKGLEADVGIILTEFNSEATKKDKIEDYIACSRAKHKLYVIEINELM